MALAVGLFFSSPHALACSCAPNLEVGFIGHEVSRLPANAAGFAWYVSKRMNRRLESIPSDRFKLEVFDGTAFYEITARVDRTDDFSTPTADFLMYLIHPAEGLTPGATYRVTDKLAAIVSGDHVERRMIVTIDREGLSADTPFAMDIGPTNHKLIELAAAISCSKRIEVAEVWITSTLPPGAHAWRDQLVYRTIVDGNPWHPTSSLCRKVLPGRSWDDIGADRVFSACRMPADRPDIPVPPQRRTVAIEAYLPGTDIVLTTPTRDVDLDCDHP